MSAPRSTLVTRIRESPWTPKVIFGGVGLAVFVLGASYLNMRTEPDLPTLLVAGGDRVLAGSPTAFRVRSRMADAKRSVPVEVHAVRVDGHAADAVTTPGSPAITRFPIPREVGASVEIAMDVSALDRSETLTFTVDALHANPEFRSPPKNPPDLPETTKKLRLDLLPEAGQLVLSMDNRVFVRVRALDGTPLANARVTVKHASLAGGATTIHTDGGGLAAFKLKASQPSFRLRLRVTAADGTYEDFERQLVPAGRQMVLRARAKTFKPGQPLDVSLHTWRAVRRIFCDLRRGPVWLWSGIIEPGDRDRAELQLAPLAAGRYDLQCYFHPHTPGRTWASRPLLVGSDAALPTLSAALAREGRVHPKALALSRETRVDDMADYLVAMLADQPVLPSILINTRAEDLSARSQRWDSRKQVVLIALGGVFLLVLLLVGELVLRNIMHQRDRFRAYAAVVAEDDIGPDEVDDLYFGPNRSRQGLVRTRGILLVVLLVGTIVANIVGFIALMALIR